MRTSSIAHKLPVIFTIQSIWTRKEAEICTKLKILLPLYHSQGSHSLDKGILSVLRASIWTTGKKNVRIGMQHLYLPRTGDKCVLDGYRVGISSDSLA
jgi:hypothetical protein